MRFSLPPPSVLLPLLAPLLAAGQIPSDLNLTGPAGKPVRFASLQGSVTAVVFVSALCPISNMYASRFNQIYETYSKHSSVKFVFVYPNANEPAAMTSEHARNIGFVFPVYRDEKRELAGALGARTTPEAFVLDASGQVRYRGALDDSQNPARVKVHGLRDAIDAVAAGRQPAISQLRAFGCVIHKPVNR